MESAITQLEFATVTVELELIATDPLFVLRTTTATAMEFAPTACVSVSIHGLAEPATYR